MPNRYQMTEQTLKILKGRFQVDEFICAGKKCRQPIQSGQWVISLSTRSKKNQYRIYHETCFPQV